VLKILNKVYKVLVIQKLSAKKVNFTSPNLHLNLSFKDFWLFIQLKFIVFMAQYQLLINKKTYTVDVDMQMPLLWVIRDIIGMTGTKFGCGIAQCGACTVHLDGVAMKTCLLPVSAAVGKQITTIEGLGTDKMHPVQQAWIDEQVPQCGYCQSGQIMAATALLAKNPNPSDEEIDVAMQGNICRCGTYQRVRQAIHTAADLMKKETGGEGGKR
jgi:aerobic-type carbon monoxide dehydrogenase small subunit (CoxS/CutS family)